MKRRSFLLHTLWLAGGAVLAGCSHKLTPSDKRGKARLVKGTVRARGRGLQGVVVSDGYSVVATNGRGLFEFTAHPAATHVFLSTPAGYAFPHKNHIASHYHPLGEGQSYDFALEPLGKDDHEHQFLIWADPQMKHQKDFQKLMATTVPDVQQLVAAAGSGALIHGISVGDIAWDELEIFDSYNEAVGQMNIPFFQCLGNHDMNYREGGDESSHRTFQQYYGPTYYSFNRGEAHYVVLDDVRYLGTERDYDGYLTAHQLDWLKKDLAHVPADKLIVLCVHIPIHRGVRNKEALYELLAGRRVHIMSGHTHFNENHIRGNIYEHVHGTVCGAWWTGGICGDGTPSGYGVYSVKGTELSWQYKSTGYPLDHQFRVFVSDFNARQKQVKVNIWNHDPEWKTEYWVDGVSKGALEQFEGFDPVAYETLLGPDKPRPRGFAEPRMTDHLFRAYVPKTAREINITATDRFGKTYSATQQL